MLETVGTVDEIIRRLQNHELRIVDVPPEFANNMEIIHAERKLGLRILSSNRYDILSRKFFIKEELIYNINNGESIDRFDFHLDDKTAYRYDSRKFQTLAEVYSFLGEEIYSSACYPFYNFEEEKDFVVKQQLDVARLKACQAYTTRTVDDFFHIDLSDGLRRFDEEEETKKECLKWLDEFSTCSSYTAFFRAVSNYTKSNLAEKINIDFFLENLVLKEEFNNRISLIVRYIFSRKYLSNRNASGWFSSIPLGILFSLCSAFDTDYIVNIYNNLLIDGKIESEVKNWRDEYIARFEKDSATIRSHSFLIRKPIFIATKSKYLFSHPAKNGLKVLTNSLYIKNTI